MKLIDIFIRANKNLGRSKSRTILTIIAIVIGSFTMMLTTALGEGVKKTVDDQVSSISVGNAIVVMGKTTPGAENPVAGEPAKYNPNADAETGMVFLDQSDVDKIKGINGVTAVFVYELISAEYITSDKTTEKYRLQVAQMMDGFEVKMIAGVYPNPEDDNYIVLTEKYVEALGYANRDEAINKEVTVIYKNARGELLIRMYSIKGIISNSFINSGSTYVSRQEGTRIAEFQTAETPLYKKYGAVIAMAAPSATKDELNQLRDDIGSHGYTAQTLDDQIAMIKGIITVVQLVIGVFGAMTVVASVFGIVNTLLMSVFERTREIGLMKAVGMSKATVFTIFAIEASSIGFWGGFIGVVLARFAGSALNGYLMTTNLLGFEGIEFFIFPTQYMLTIILSLTLVGLISGVLPAMRASSLDPIEALRNE